MPSCFLFKYVPGSSLNAFGSTPGGIPVWKYPLGLDLVDCSFVHWRYLVDFRLGKKKNPGSVQTGELHLGLPGLQLQASSWLGLR